jgi:hypothetical protein
LPDLGLVDGRALDSETINGLARLLSSFAACTGRDHLQVLVPVFRFVQGGRRFVPMSALRGEDGRFDRFDAFASPETSSPILRHENLRKVRAAPYRPSRWP